MERRGVRVDHTHDIAGLTAGFGARRPDESALAERMAGLDGAGHRHHVALYRFRPPEIPDVKAAVTRLAGGLDLWASEIEVRDDDMAGVTPALARFAAGQVAAWHDRAAAPVSPKPVEDGQAQAAGEAAMEGRTVLADAIASFRHRMQRAVAGPATGEGSGPSEC